MGFVSDKSMAADEPSEDDGDESDDDECCNYRSQQEALYLHGLSYKVLKNGDETM